MTASQQTRQLSFSQVEYESKKKKTRSDVFLAKMESVVPWARLVAVVETFYPKSGTAYGNTPTKASSTSALRLVGKGVVSLALSQQPWLLMDSPT